MSRLRWALAVTLVGLCLSLPAGAALSPCGPGGSTDSVGAGWIASAPNYPSGHGETSLFASPAFDPNTLFASNGSVVMRSDDAGCGWMLVYDAAKLAGLPNATVAVTALSVPSSANNSRYVYVGLTRDIAGGVTTPFIAVSRDRGRHFVESPGLPAVGGVTGIVGNAQVPDVAYATIDVTLPATSSQQVYATTDGGAAWSQRTPSGESFDGRQLTSHPTVQTELFAVSRGVVRRSDNGGVSFSDASPGGTVRELRAAPGAGGLRLVSARADGTIATSGDLGESWVRLTSPVAARSVAPAPLQPVVAVSGADATYLLLPAAEDITPGTGAPGDLSITAPTAKGYAITGLLGGTLVRLTVDPAGKPIVPVTGPGGVVRPVTLLPPGAVTQFPSLLLPSGLHLSLAAGETRLVPYRLLVPRTPTPVDLLFAVDSTGSMAPVIDDLRTGIRDIVNALDSAGLDARFGLGDFQDYPAPDGPGSTGSWPWRLDRGIGPVDSELQSALSRLHTGGGTTDGGTSGYGALYESTTGTDILAGHVEPVDEAIAGYRKGSLRLAMLASDAPAHEGGERAPDSRGPDRNGKPRWVTEPGPNSDQLIAELLHHDVHAMGLAVSDGSGNPAGYMRLLAEGSHTLAPAGGVDCDGNGVADLAEGDPLVCRLIVPATATGVDTGLSSGRPATGLTAAVVGLAAGIPDIKPIAVSVSRGAAFARPLSARRTVNLHADNELAFQLEVHCPLAQASQQQIDLVGATDAKVLVNGSLDLSCAGVALPAPAAAVVAAVPPPAPAPAQPVPQPQPQPNPNPNPNPNPAVNINVNPGVADQQEQMPQLAMAESSEQEAVSMSGLAFVTVAGLLTCTAGGLALRRREALSLQR